MSEENDIRNADQTEIEALFNTSAPMDAGLVDERQASAFDSIDFIPLDGNADWFNRDSELDEVSSELTTEISTRSVLLQNAYPFEIEHAGLKVKLNEPNIFYLFCLILSNSSLKAQRGTEAVNQRMARIFERVSLKLIAAMLGSYSHPYHFGFPRDDQTGIEEAMLLLPEKLDVIEEWKCNPMAYNMEDLNSQKDLGIDQIIAIKCPSNRKFGSLYILGQCACGQDYKKKFNDISLRKLDSYFRPFTYVPPVKAMSVPFRLSDNEFCRVSNEAGWLFDRVSLSNIYFNSPNLRNEYDAQLVDLIAASVPYGERFQTSTLYNMLNS